MKAPRLRSNRVSHVPLKLLLQQLVAVSLNDLVRLHRQGFGEVRHGRLGSKSTICQACTRRAVSESGRGTGVGAPRRAGSASRASSHPPNFRDGWGLAEAR